MNMEAVKRFLNYVTFDTQSNEESTTVPSTAKQKVLGLFLLEELKSLGIKDARMDDFGYVYAYLPSKSESNKTIGLISHMDTSPDAAGHDINPRIVTVGEEDIEIGNGLKLEKVDLQGKVGHQLIVTDGTTLLGADDKAGIAIIMSVVEHIINCPGDYPNVVVCFTPDEEVGRGTDHFDYEWYKKIAPNAFTYTIDGGDITEINYETFNAASVKVTIKGKSIHPGSAKNKMINASIVAMELFNLLPALSRPEHTDNYEGFFHLTNMSGDVSEAHLSFIIRDHDRTLFERRKEMLRKAVEEINYRYGQELAECTIEDSYYNMRSEIMKKPELISLVKKAMEKHNIAPIERPIRGGTDGARLSFEGIPCPNLGTGGENFHGPLEYLDINDFQSMIEVVIEMLKLVVHEA